MLYFVVFSFLIKKFNYKTPGREPDNEETKLYTRRDYEARKKGSSGAGATSNDDRTSALIVKGLGGRENISDIDCCATRLRITVKDSSSVDESALKESGASGVIRKGNGVQIIYGPQVSVVKSHLDDFLDSERSFDVDEMLSKPYIEDNEDKTEGGNSSAKPETLLSPLRGKIVPLCEVKDEAFSSGVLGKGVAIEPSEGKLYAPCDGKIESMLDSRHALNIVSTDGCEILLHVGIDTVKLNGRFFRAHVSDGQTIKRGDLLLSFDIAGIKDAGYSVITPVVVCNSDDYSEVESVATGDISVGSEIIKVK